MINMIKAQPTSNKIRANNKAKKKRWLDCHRRNTDALPTGATGRADDGRPKYHRLIPTGRTSKDKYWRAECKCDCGKTKWVSLVNLMSGHTKSCGCYMIEFASGLSRRLRLRHGATVNGKSSPEYSSWRSMKSRCEKKYDIGYERYGGRGISVCEKWKTFDGFIADMGKRPEGTSLDRIDNNANYSKENCRWATDLQQNRNRSCVVLIEFNGQIKCKTEWAHSAGMTRAAFTQRLKKMTMQEALSKPIRNWKKGSRNET